MQFAEFSQGSEIELVALWPMDFQSRSLYTHYRGPQKTQSTPSNAIGNFPARLGQVRKARFVTAGQDPARAPLPSDLFLRSREWKFHMHATGWDRDYESMPSPIADSQSESSGDRGACRFVAKTSPMALFMLTHFGDIMDGSNNGKRCGRLLSCAPHIGPKHEFVLLSRFEVKLNRDQDFYQQDGLLNAMLIEWFGSRAERVAIGEICEDVCEAKNPVKQEIELV
ncbi:Fc.00g079290.m01.CDS01 [Cosmosporella sp. VM-42]